jgi:hypothetical protein
MNTKQIKLKTSAIGVLTAALLAVGGPLQADERSPLLWAGQFKDAYNGESPQSASRVNANFRVQDGLIWAVQVEEAYSPSSQGSRLVTRPDAGKYLAWAGHFRGVYGPARQEAVEEIGDIEVAMDRN